MKELKIVQGPSHNGSGACIQIDKKRYSSQEFSPRFDLIGTRVVVHIDPEDARAVQAFDSNGLPLGELVAHGHSRHAKRYRAMLGTLNRLPEPGVIRDFGSDVVDVCRNQLLRHAGEQAEKSTQEDQPCRLTGGGTRERITSHEAVNRRDIR
ncbi:hypothetical protein [Ideonella sp. YS5]|uniref:hypothetical protein n=1 Tax=Ideonella sp. YS5 TaxID=3453714 RepID=UPI003EEF8EDF